MVRFVWPFKGSCFFLHSCSRDARNCSKIVAYFNSDRGRGWCSPPWPCRLKMWRHKWENENEKTCNCDTKALNLLLSPNNNLQVPEVKYETPPKSTTVSTAEIQIFSMKPTAPNINKWPPVLFCAMFRVYFHAELTNVGSFLQHRRS